MLRLVTDHENVNPARRMAAELRAAADLIEGGLKMQYGLIVAKVDGGATYAPLGDLTLTEATGLLVLVSRKVERDLTR